MAQVKKTYDFKSVGELQSEFSQREDDTVSNTPVGILTPISFDQSSSSMFLMSNNVKDQVRDNLRNLLITNHGERLMLTDFGANLKELAYDMTSEQVISEALVRISQAASKFMPFVSLDTFQVSSDVEQDSIVNTISVGYSIPALNVINQTVEVSIVVAN